MDFITIPGNQQKIFYQAKGHKIVPNFFTCGAFIEMKIYVESCDSFNKNSSHERQM